MGQKPCREIGVYYVALPLPATTSFIVHQMNTGSPIDLRLSNISNTIYFLPDVLFMELSTLVQLESLTVSSHSLAYSHRQIEDFMAEIGFPPLCKIAF